MPKTLAQKDLDWETLPYWRSESEDFSNFLLLSILKNLSFDKRQMSD